MEKITNKEVYTTLQAHNYLDYGSVIPIKLFRDLCNIETLDTGTKEQFDDIALAELGYANYIRNKLLHEGKYLKGERDSYRVLLPSENAGQVMALTNSASNKLKKAIKLNSTTPVEYKIQTNDEARMMMKNDDIDSRRKK